MKNKILLIICLFLSTIGGFSQQATHSFTLADSAFLLDGKPMQIISGEIHYPRVNKEAWRQRLKMAKAMGLNTISTYVFWNLHEPLKGKYDFTGNNNVAEFIKIAQEEGLWVILRPSPYVCAEWEFGGYPFWLQNEKGLVVRSKESQYLKAYRNYINEVGKQLAPLQINHGGNILMVQVENEYGSYGSDKEYLDINKKMFIDAGFNGLLYTCDPASDLANGHLPGLLPAVNGLDNPAQVKSLIRQNNNGKGPYLIAEWYPAWFDWWGTKHHTVSPEKYAVALDSVLASGISINMYMFHGGTTRGFMNGANLKKNISPFEPQISSYDYDAPLDEAGNTTAKFMLFRNVIQKYLPAGQTLPVIPAKKKVITIPTINFNKQLSLLDCIAKPTSNIHPLSFEDLNQAYGFVLYRTITDGNVSGILKIKDLRDYAIIFINGKRVAVLDRRLNEDSIKVSLPKGKVVLDILVENMGRINFGAYLLQNKKGITETVMLNNKELNDWKMYGLPLSDIASVTFKENKIVNEFPVMLKGSFVIKTTGDTYLDMSNFGKGIVWVNGHNLGKYWGIGPQQTLYLPVEWLREGTNEIIVLDLVNKGSHDLKGLDHAVLDQLK